MDDPDRTALLPRQRILGDVADRPRVDRWEVDQTKAVGVAWVDGTIGRERALRRLAWVLATIVAACLGLARSSWAGLSAAELSVWGFATTPWPEALRLARVQEAAEMPYRLLARAWVEIFGVSEFALRAPSVLAMSATAGVTAALASHLFSAKAGLLAGLFVAVLPTTSRYAHEAGPQALTVLAAVVATLTLVRVFDRPGFRRFAAYAVAVALLGLAHAGALVLLLAHAVAVLAMRRSAAPAWLAAAVVGALPSAAVLVGLGPSTWRTPTEAITIPLPSTVDLAAAVFGPLLLAGAMVGLALLGASAARSPLVFTAWALVPLVAAYVALGFTAYPLSLLAVLTLPAWAVLAARSLHSDRLVRGGVAVAVVVAFGLPTQVDIRRADGHTFASRQAGTILAEQATPADALVFGATPTEAQLGRDVVARYVPASRRPRDVLLVRRARVDGHPFAEECADVPTCLAGAARVWIIREGAPDSPLDGFPAAKDGALRVSYTVASTWRLRGLTLYLLARA
jgi:mannosyltransferase